MISSPFITEVNKDHHRKTGSDYMCCFYIGSSRHVCSCTYIVLFVATTLRVETRACACSINPGAPYRTLKEIRLAACACGLRFSQQSSRSTTSKNTSDSPSLADSQTLGHTSAWKTVQLRVVLDQFQFCDLPLSSNVTQNISTQPC